MVRAIVLTICGIVLYQNLFSQLIHLNTYFPDIDEPLQYNGKLKKFDFSTISYLYCKDTLLQVRDCSCRKIGRYDTAGRLVQLSAGSDVFKDSVDYVAKYERLSDTLFKVVTRFSSQYISKWALFQYDTVVKGKLRTRTVYTRETNDDIVVSSFLKYKEGSDVPHRIDRFDKEGKLREIYYPQGNRIATEYFDTSKMDDRKHVRYRAVYPENEFTSEQVYNIQGRLLESKTANRSFNGFGGAEYTTYVYDERDRVVQELTRDENNEFVREKRYFYKDSVLIKITRDSDLADSTENEVSLFNDAGALVERQENSSNYPRNTWQWKYHYRNGLQIRTDILKNGVYQQSIFLIYE